MKFYYAQTKDDFYHAVVAGETEEEVIQALKDQLGLSEEDDEEWELTELSNLPLTRESPIILTDGW